MSVMPSEKELEHNVSLLKKLLELEHERLKAEHERANKWQADCERKDQIIESLRLLSKKTDKDNTDWSLIKKHFNDLLEEESIPQKTVKDTGKKRIRREANDRATAENLLIRKYSDSELRSNLKFPHNTVSRRFVRQHRKK